MIRLLNVRNRLNRGQLMRKPESKKPQVPKVWSRRGSSVLSSGTRRLFDAVSMAPSRLSRFRDPSITPFSSRSIGEKRTSIEKESEKNQDGKAGWIEAKEWRAKRFHRFRVANGVRHPQSREPDPIASRIARSSCRARYARIGRCQTRFSQLHTEMTPHGSTSQYPEKMGTGACPRFRLGMHLNTRSDKISRDWNQAAFAVLEKNQDCKAGWTTRAIRITDWYAGFS